MKVYWNVFCSTGYTLREFDVDYPSRAAAWKARNQYAKYWTRYRYSVRLAVRTNP